MFTLSVKQLSEAQSESTLQSTPIPHLAGHSDPPQSTPVSFPSFNPLLQTERVGLKEGTLDGLDDGKREGALDDGKREGAPEGELDGGARHKKQLSGTTVLQSSSLLKQKPDIQSLLTIHES